MLLEETEAPMDFSRSSDISEFQHRRSEMEQFEHRKPEPQNYEMTKSEEVSKGLDLSHSVLDRLSQRVIRLGPSKIALIIFHLVHKTSNFFKNIFFSSL